jgi:hypothetical protein
MQTEDQNPLQSGSPTETDQAQTLAQDPSESSTEPSEHANEPPQEQQKPKTDWAQRRIDRLTWEKNEEKRQREALAAELAQYRQPTEQQQQQQHGQPQDIDQLVEQRAAAKIADQNFNQACNRVFDAGVKADPNFKANLATLQSVGEITRDFLELVTDMDEGHKVLNHLGANPDEADRILALPPLKQARELAKLEASLGKAAPPPPVSKAPAPITPVGSKAAPVEPESFASTADYIAWHKQNRKR